MAYKVTDFADIYTMVAEELKLQLSDTDELNRIKRDINAIYIDEVWPFKRWKWAMGSTAVKHPAYYASDTVSVTPNSTTVTLSTAPSASIGSLAGRKFAVDNEDDVYTIASHTAESTTVVLSIGYNGSLNATASFKIWADSIALPTDLKETIEVVHSQHRVPMDPMGLQEYRRIVAADPRYQGRPQWYTTYDFEDPSGGDETESDRYRVLKVHPAVLDMATIINIDYVREVSALEDDGDEPALPIGDRIVLVYGALSRAWTRQRNPEAAAQNYGLYQAKLARMAGNVEDGFDKPQFTPSSEYMSKKRGPRMRSGIRGSGAAGGGSTYSAPTYLQNVTINGATLTGNVTASSGITVDGVDISTLSSDFSAHLVDTTDAHVASAITVTPSGDLASTDVQSALEELQADIGDIVNLDNGKILLGDVTNTAVQVTPSGDVTINNAGVTAITAGVIVNADINASAAIARSKVATGTTNRLVVNDGVTGALIDAAAITASRALVSDADGIPVHATTTSTEIGYVNGVTSAIQTQINTKAPTASPTFTGTITTPLTASRAVVTGGSSQLAVATTTATEIGYVNGVTSAIQTQLDAKVAKSTATAKGDLFVATASATVTNKAVGSDGQVLTADSAQATGVSWTTLDSSLDASYNLLNLSIAASVSANALTIALKDKSGSDPSAGSPVKVAFRNATIATGTYVQRSVTGATSLVISSGSTLGHASARAFYIWIYALDNAGTVELAASTTLFDTSGVLSTTAEGGAGAADSNATIYSTTARSNVAMRPIARLTVTEATAGTWATAPSQITLLGPDCSGCKDVIHVAYDRNSTQSTTNGNTVTVIHDDYVADTHNAYDTSTGIFTAPRAGLAVISICSTMNTFSAANILYVLSIAKNGTTATRSVNLRSSGTADHSAMITATIDLAKGDTIRARLFQNSGSGTHTTTSNAPENFTTIRME